MMAILVASITLNVAIVSWIIGKRIYYHRPGAVHPDRHKVLAEIQAITPIQAGDVVVIGDSIAAALPCEQLGWKNRGIPGDTSEGVLARVGDIAVGRPSVVYLQVGINDLVEGTPIEEYITNLGAIINHLRGCTICVHSLFPQTPYAATIQEWNEHIELLCLQRRVDFIDVYKPFLPFNRYTWDGAHLNAEGYRKWLEILAAIKKPAPENRPG